MNRWKRSILYICLGSPGGLALAASDQPVQSYSGEAFIQLVTYNNTYNTNINPAQATLTMTAPTACNTTSGGAAVQWALPTTTVDANNAPVQFTYAPTTTNDKINYYDEHAWVWDLLQGNAVVSVSCTVTSASNSYQATMGIPIYFSQYFFQNNPANLKVKGGYGLQQLGLSSNYSAFSSSSSSCSLSNAETPSSY